MGEVVDILSTILFQIMNERDPPRDGRTRYPHALCRTIVGELLERAKGEGVTLVRGRNVKDCTKIAGDSRVIISWSTAEEALCAMLENKAAGRYKNLFRDDQSFISYEIGELEEAIKWDKTPHIYKDGNDYYVDIDRG